MHQEPSLRCLKSHGAHYNQRNHTSINSIALHATRPLLLPQLQRQKLSRSRRPHPGLYYTIRTLHLSAYTSPFQNFSPTLGHTLSFIYKYHLSRHLHLLIQTHIYIIKHKKKPYRSKALLLSQTTGTLVSLSGPGFTSQDQLSTKTLQHFRARTTTASPTHWVINGEAGK